MTACFPLRRKPRAFTLVEMLTVIIIIGILSGLLLVALQAARVRARVATIKAEVTELDLALENYQQQFGDYPPDFSGVGHPNATIRTDGRQRVLRHIRKRFPRYQLAGSVDAQWIAFGTAVWNATRTSPYPDFPTADPAGDPTAPGRGLYVTEFDPRAAMIFWLGGLPASYGSTELTGFSANVAAPFVAGGSRTPRLFEFKVDRIGYATPDFTRLDVPVYTGQSVPIYGSFSVSAFPGATYPTGSRTTATPYVYFRPRAGGVYFPTSGAYAYYDVRPYYDNGSGRWVEPERFQIISAGLDGGFGAISTAGPPAYQDGAYYPAGGNFTLRYSTDPVGTDRGTHEDNITNFTENGTIKDDMP